MRSGGNGKHGKKKKYGFLKIRPILERTIHRKMRKYIYRRCVSSN